MEQKKVKKKLTMAYFFIMEVAYINNAANKKLINDAEILWFFSSL